MTAHHTSHHAFARSDRSALGMWWWTVDRWLLGAVAILMVIGVALSFASSPAAAARFSCSSTLPLREGQNSRREFWGVVLRHRPVQDSGERLA